MKAYVLKNINDLNYEDVKIPECKPGWSIVKVKAAGICSSDIPRIYKKGTYHFPTVPGHEFSGLVISVADKENAYLVGKKVGVFPLIPCKTCDQCRTGHYEMCRNYDYIGSRRDGSFAEYVAVPVWNLIELDDSISFEAAAMMEPLAVAYHAIIQSGIKTGESIGIFGTGMIGFAAAQWAVKKGAAKVVVIGRSDDKRPIADKIPGVTYQVSSTLNEEFDVVLEAVGSNESLISAIQTVKAGGTVVAMGNPNGDMHLSQDVYWRILRKQLRIVGTWNSSYEKNSQCDWSIVAEALKGNEINPEFLISHRYNKENLIDGLNLMRLHQEPYCKVMTIWN